LSEFIDAKGFLAFVARAFISKFVDACQWRLVINITENEFTSESGAVCVTRRSQMEISGATSFL
jgi:hypothetical protein